MLDQFQKRKFLKNQANDLLVLLGLDAAGAVDKGTARPEEGNAGAHDASLRYGHAQKIFGGKAPPEIDAAAHHAGVVARRVDQDPIELGPIGRPFARCPVVSKAADVANPKPL